MGQTISSVGATSRARTRPAVDQRRKKQSRLGAQIKAVMRTEMQTDEKTTNVSSRIDDSQNPSICASNKVGKDTWISLSKVEIPAPRSRLIALADDGAAELCVRAKIENATLRAARGGGVAKGIVVRFWRKTTPLTATRAAGHQFAAVSRTGRLWPASRTLSA